MTTIIETNDAAGDATTLYTLVQGDILEGTIASVGDVDKFRVSVGAGELVYFTLEPLDSSVEGSISFAMTDAAGVRQTFGDFDFDTFGETLTFRAPSGGDWYLEVIDRNLETGGYRLTWADLPANFEGTDLPADITTTAQIIEGADAFEGHLSPGDSDWLALDINSGDILELVVGDVASRIELFQGLGLTSSDLSLNFYNAAGEAIDVPVTRNGDFIPGGYGEKVILAGLETQTIYLEISSTDPAQTGSYQLSTTLLQNLPDVPASEVVTYMGLGYWQDFYNAFNEAYPPPAGVTPFVPNQPLFISPGPSGIEVNLDDLSASEQAVIWQSFDALSAASGVSFVAGNSPIFYSPELTYFGQITYRAGSGPLVFELVSQSTFQNLDTGEQALVHSGVVINQDRFDESGDISAGDYMLFLRLALESLGIGGLGLGGSPIVGVDGGLNFRNDAFAYSLLATQNNSDNLFVNASDLPVVSLMEYDILTLQTYFGGPGASDTTGGNTTWGHGSALTDMGAQFFSDFVNQTGEAVAFTIRDAGGIDTVNLSPLDTDNRVDLTAGALSDIGGYLGNLVISSGSDIENVTTGNGNDDILGNGLGNAINAGRGNDTLDGGAGNDDLRAGVGNDMASGGLGNDTIRGGIGEDTLNGDGGNDSIVGQRNGDILEGGAGRDTLKGGGGNDTLNGGDDNDFIKGGTRADVLNGGDGDDRIFANSFADVLNGDGGNDVLNAGGDNDTLNGGTGNDTLKGGGGADTFIFEAGMGADVVLDFNAAQDVLEISSALAGGADAAGLAAAADVSAAGIRLDLEGGSSILLAGVGDTDALATAIRISPSPSSGMMSELDLL